MPDPFCGESALWCISSGESLCVFGKVLLVGFVVWPVNLGLGSLVSGTDDVP